MSDIAPIVMTLQSREMQRDLRAFVPPNVDFTKFMQSAISAVQRSGAILAKCDRQSVYNAIADAASRGLLPDGRQGAIVPYRTYVKTGKSEGYYQLRAQFLIMPEGIIECAARAGSSVYAVSVYAGDHVRLWNDGEGMHFEHEYHAFTDRGDMVGAVAVGRTRAGQTYVEAVNSDDIAKIKAVSKQKDQEGNMIGPWKEWEDRMWQKSALHRLHKRMPGVSIPDDDEWAGQTERLKIRAEDPPTRTQELNREAARTLSQTPTSGQMDTPAAVVPRGTSAAQKRPKGLQRLVDNKTGEVFEPGGAASTSEPPKEPSAGPASEAPPPDPTETGDTF